MKAKMFSFEITNVETVSIFSLFSFNFKYNNIHVFTFQYFLLMMKLFYTTHVLNDQGKMTENDTDVCTVLLKLIRYISLVV